MKEEFITAVEQLKQWIIQNKAILEEKTWKDGKEVLEVEHLTFNANPIDKDEVIEIRALTKNILPESYYYFLSEIGSGQFFISKYLPSFEIYSLAELLEYNNLIQQELKEAEGTGRDEFFMIGVHSSMGDWIGFCTSKKDVKNLDVYTHEYPIDEYVDTSNELNSWCSFEEWVIKAISTKGQKAL